MTPEERRIRFVMEVKSLMRLSRFALPLAATLCLSLVSCSESGKPRPPQPGTPPFFWAAANNAWQKGNIEVTAERLRDITSSQNEFTARAQVWLMAISTGLAQAEMDWSNVLDEGRLKARDSNFDYRRHISAARSASGQQAMRAIEIAHDFVPKLTDPEIPLDFKPIAGSAEMPPDLARISQGYPVQPVDLDKMRNLMHVRGVVRASTRLAAAAADPGKTKITRDAYMLHLAKELMDLTALYAPKKLDQPARIKLLCEEAGEALKAIPASDETKKLQQRIDGVVKKLPKNV